MGSSVRPQSSEDETSQPSPHDISELDFQLGEFNVINLKQILQSPLSNTVAHHPELCLNTSPSEEGGCYRETQGSNFIWLTYT